MISINTNYGGLFAAKATQQSQNLIDKAMERLSTGKRINYAKDDAAGSAIAVRMTAEIQGLAVASRNAAENKHKQTVLDTLHFYSDDGMKEIWSLWQTCKQHYGDPRSAKNSQSISKYFSDRRMECIERQTQLRAQLEKQMGKAPGPPCSAAPRGAAACYEIESELINSINCEHHKEYAAQHVAQPDSQ